MSKKASSFPKPSLVNFATGLFCILILSSCAEKRKLEIEITKLKQEIESYRAQLQTANDEFELTSKSLMILRSQQSTNVKSSTYEETARKLAVEMNTLTEREKTLEQTVHRLKESMDSYKKYSP